MVVVVVMVAMAVVVTVLVVVYVAAAGFLSRFLSGPLPYLCLTVILYSTECCEKQQTTNTRS